MHSFIFATWNAFLKKKGWVVFWRSHLWS